MASSFWWLIAFVTRSESVVGVYKARWDRAANQRRIIELSVDDNAETKIRNWHLTAFLYLRMETQDNTLAYAPHAFPAEPWDTFSCMDCGWWNLVDAVADRLICRSVRA